MPHSAIRFFLGFSLLVFAGPAQADKRVALVVGISNYREAPRLANPVRDADAVTALFRKAGFDIVDSERDLGIADLRRAIREFSGRSRDADIAVIYYAGHGMEVEGTNYLVPADAKLSNDFDVEDEAMSLDRVLRALDPVKRLRLVILDACRDNPFSRTMKRTVASRSIGRGLAKIEPTMSNTLVAFAAKAGAVAEDGGGDNSPFASALVKYIAEPGVDLRIAFGRVRDEVLRVTDNRQEPFVYGSLGGETVALVPQAAKSADAEVQPRIDYELAAQIGTREAWDSFLARYPTGLYADLARAQNNKLLAAQQTHTSADNARRDAEEKAAQRPTSCASSMNRIRARPPRQSRSSSNRPGRNSRRPGGGRSLRSNRPRLRGRKSHKPSGRRSRTRSAKSSKRESLPTKPPSRMPGRSPPWCRGRPVRKCRCLLRRSIRRTLRDCFRLI
jgi:hypothetical protein